MNSHDKIVDVRVATVLAPLPKPVEFGPWLMRHREFAVCVIRAESGVVGRAFSYTRDGPVAAIVERLVAPHYAGAAYDDPAALTFAAQFANNPNLSSSTGYRALGLVDLATWDLKARAAGVSITQLLDGQRRPLPVTAIVGYPPSTDAEEVRDQVRDLWAAGWRRFKQPVAATEEQTVARMRAACEAAPDGWHGLDANWIYRTAEDAIAFTRKLDGLPIGWFEDIVPPGDAALVAAIREGSDIPIAMGDEQGGAYHPDALIAAGAIDVVRIDITMNGGLSRLERVIARAEAAGLPFTPHMFAHKHSQVLSALGYVDTPIEWGVPWSGVDQFADSLAQPTVRDGLMEPLAEAPGFGEIVNVDWIAEQEVDDPHGALAGLD
jgi:L-alanine-DL-glutamate epimerase-like enolase superfamily enzyme